MNSVPESWRRRIAELVDAAPPLDPARRDRLGALLRTSAPQARKKPRRRRPRAA